MTRRVRTFAALIFTLVFGFVVIVGSGAAYALYRLPALQGLGASVAAIDRREHVPYVQLNKVAPMLPRALIATEDRSFYSNIGVSFEGIARSLIVDLATGRFTEGGSTITQQLVRDQLLTQAKTIPRKVEELVLSIALTQIASKRQILAMYLNEVYLGDGAYGVYAASERYFGRTPAALTAAQCTVLAGLPQAPSLYDPLVNPKLARARQREVVASMVAAKALTQSEANTILAAPWHLR